MKRSTLLLVTIFATLMAGCESLSPQGAASAGSSDADDEKAYLTGSRIPVKDKTINTRTTDKNTIDTIYRRSQVCVGGGVCGGVN